MERLSFIDQAMHKLTTTGLAPADMQGVMIVNPANAPVKITPQMLGQHIIARLSDFPILRKKLVQDPLGIGDVRLVDDPAFNVSDHIQYSALPEPGTQNLLDRHLAHFSAQRLDLDHPLWRFEIISGLEGGRIAIAQKLSHATMDGMAAMKLMAALFDSEPRPPDAPKEKHWEVDPEPTRKQLLTDALKETGVRFYLNAPSMLGKKSIDLLGNAIRNFSTKSKSAPAEKTAPAAKPQRTSLNQAISSDRRVIAYRSFELDKLKKLSRSLGCTINDLCVLMASAAFTSYFDGIGETVDFDLFSMLPLSTRAAGDTKAGNALAIKQINLHTTIEDPVERLKAIQAQMSVAKTERSASMDTSASDKSPKPAELLGLLSPIVLDLVGAVLSRLKPWSKVPVITNTLITNVPGPRERVYFAGMPIEEQIPIIPIGPTCALTIGITSMENNLAFGFHGCGEAIEAKNMHFFVDGLSDIHLHLQALVAEQPESERKQIVEQKPKRKAAAKSRAKKPRGKSSAAPRPKKNKPEKQTR